MSKHGKRLLDLTKRMFSAKAAVDAFNQEIALEMYPERADFTGGAGLHSNMMDNIIDPFPIQVRRELGDQIGSMVRPSDRDWFAAYVDGKKASRSVEARSYLEFVTDVNRSILYDLRSGFARHAKGLEHDYSAFGIGWGRITYNRNRDGLVFSHYHPRDCAGGVDEAGNLDKVFRRFDVTARALLKQVGDEALLPQKIREALKDSGRSKEEFTVYHIEIPVEDWDGDRKLPPFIKYWEVYLSDDGHIIKQIPLPVFDYIGARWQTLDGTFYPFSPSAVVALPQARLLQRMAETTITAAELRVAPPMIAQGDAVISPVNIAAGAVTYVDKDYDERTGAVLRPLDLGGDVRLGEAMGEKSKDALIEAFYINKLTPVGQGANSKTAYEVSQLVQEYIRTALPLFEPIETEWTGRLLEITTEKVMKVGGYGPIDTNGVPVDMPDALLGEDIKYRFNNALKEARDQQVVAGFMAGAEMIGAAAQLDPTIVNHVNAPKMFRDSFGAITGAKADWLKGEDESKAEAEAQAAAMAEQAQLQQLAEVAPAAQAAVSVAKEVDGA